MEIHLHNSKTRAKERFAPLNPEDVRMYVCGPTVYDCAHIGNARPVVVFDLLYRLLRHGYGADRVRYVRNITDVEDKINERAARDFPDLAPEAGIAALTARTTDQFHADMAALGCMAPSEEPRATAHIAGMIALISDLIAKGFAYEAEGHVLFEVGKYAAYGALSGRSTDDMIAGARVEIAPYKRDPMDFVLWKPSDASQPGWESPWGKGRPGWHIECSAMAKAAFGESFDIHGGGADLMFPHHENEIAQSACAHDGAEMAQVWLHNGMIRVDGRKMSKSLGNFLTVEDLRGRAEGAVLRLVLLSTQYRGELDWTDKVVSDAEKALRTWAAAAEGAPEGGAPDAKLLAALADDLNTPAAIARLHELAKKAKRDDSRAAAFRASLDLMGFPAEMLAALAEPDAPDEGVAEIVEALLDERAEARAARNFARADAIRDGLAHAGIEVMDQAGTSAWTLSLGAAASAMNAEAGAAGGSRGADPDDVRDWVRKTLGAV